MNDSDPYEAHVKAAYKASMRSGLRLCRLPLKPLICGVIDVRRMATEAAGSRHEVMMKQAADILDGTHNAWKTLLRRANEVWGPGPPSALNESHLDDLRKFGAAESIPRNSPALVSRLFLTPKSDGLTSRPILDARVQNEMVDWNEVQRGKFRLLQPLGHIRVGVGLGVEGEMELFEADAVSYFPAFRWSEALGRAHAFRVGGRRFAHAVPAQGSCLMPLVAQTVSAYLAESPVVDAPSGAFIRSRVSIVYDKRECASPNKTITRAPKPFPPRSPSCLPIQRAAAL